MRVTGSRSLLLGRGLREPDHRSVPYTASETVVLFIAGLSAVIGLIHASAAVKQIDTFAPNFRVYAVLAAIEISWAAVLVARGSRAMLLFGLGFNLAGLALWIAAQAFGLSAVQRPWTAGAAGGIHAIFWCTATLGGGSSGWQATVAAVVQPADEVLIAIAAASVVLRRRAAVARRITERMAPVLLAALLVSILYGVGAHAG
jgi:hypothetical protein